MNDNVSPIDRNNSIGTLVAMIKNILLAIVSVFIAVVLLEFSLQVISTKTPRLPEKPKSNWALVPERIWTQHHSILGWFHQSNKHAILRLRDYQVDINTNSIGLRSAREYNLIKPVGVIRIAAVGDSFFFGWGVRGSETFSAVLESKFINLEVMNFGIPGYGIDQIDLTYRIKAARYKPDYVLIGIFPEDFWRATRSFADTGHAKPYFSLSIAGELQLHNVPTPPKFALKTKQFPEIIHHGRLEKLLMQSLVYRLVKQGAIRMGKNLGWVDPDTEDEWILGKAILRDIIARVKNDGAHPVILLMPPDRWVRDKKPDSLRKSILKFVKAEQIDFIDLTPDFQEACQRSQITDYYIDGDWHWTPRGQDLTASLIEKYLIKQGVPLKNGNTAA